jgi:hypothetical protein
MESVRRSSIFAPLDHKRAFSLLAHAKNPAEAGLSVNAEALAGCWAWLKGH